MGNGDGQQQRLVWTGGHNVDGQDGQRRWETVMGNRARTVTVMVMGDVDGWTMVTGDREGQWRRVTDNCNGQQAR